MLAYPLDIPVLETGNISWQELYIMVLLVSFGFVTENFVWNTVTKFYGSC